MRTAGPHTETPKNLSYGSLNSPAGLVVVIALPMAARRAVLAAGSRVPRTFGFIFSFPTSVSPWERPTRRNSLLEV